MNAAKNQCLQRKSPFPLEALVVEPKHGAKKGFVQQVDTKSQWCSQLKTKHNSLSPAVMDTSLNCSLSVGSYINHSSEWRYEGEKNSTGLWAQWSRNSSSYSAEVQIM